MYDKECFWTDVYLAAVKAGLSAEAAINRADEGTRAYVLRFPHVAPKVVNVNDQMGSNL